MGTRTRRTIRTGAGAGLRSERRAPARVLGGSAVALAVAASVLLAAPAAQAAPVTVPDPALLACLNAAIDPLRDPAAPVDDAELAALTTVSCVGRGVSDLTGAQSLVGATSLRFGDNSISDLAPLAGLTAVTSLGVENNPVADLGPLSGLTALTFLDVAGTGADDLGPLAGLTGLTILNAEGLGAQDLTPLSSLVGMRSMNLRGNEAGDLAPLAPLTALVQLDVSGTGAPSLAPLAGASGLEILFADDNALRDVDVVAGFPGLLRLHVARNAIADLSPLAGLGALTKVVADDQLIDLGTVAVGEPQPGIVVDESGADVPMIVASGPGVYDAGADTWTWTAPTTSSDPGIVVWSHVLPPSLGGVFSGVIRQGAVDAVDVPDATFLACLNLALGGPPTRAPGQPVTEAELASLTSLNCRDLGIADITGAEGLVAVESLVLGDNPIGSIAPLTGLPALVNLDLENTAAGDLAPLAGAARLATLDLSGVALGDLAPLGDLPAIDLLDISHTGIGDDALPVLAANSTLRTLFAGNNHLTDLSPLGALPDLGLLIARDQTVALPSVPAGRHTTSPFRWIDGSVIAPATLSAGGSSDPASATWLWSDPGVASVTWERTGGDLGLLSFGGTATQVVTARPPVPPAPDVPDAGNGLARTGADPAGPSIATAAGLLMLLAGAAILAARAQRPAGRAGSRPNPQEGTRS